MIEIDGSFLEGGGQILRTAISLSAITKKPCTIFNIRKGREKPGLMPQHLVGIQNVARLCNGYLEGDKLGSTEIKFYPKEIIAKDLQIKIETAGSIPLCLQSLVAVSLFASKSVKIFFDGGGTDVPFSPTIDYFRFCFLKILKKMEAEIEIDVLKRGYYPMGGSLVKTEIYPSKLKALNLTEKGRLEKILIFSFASDFLKKKKVAERQAKSAEEIFKKIKLPVESKIEYQKTDSAGSSILVAAQFKNTILGADELGKLEIPAEEIGRKCASQLLEEEKSGTCLDRFLTDQILIYLALSKQQCSVKISQLTNHAKTILWLIPQFIEGNFELKNSIISWIPK